MSVKLRDFSKTELPIIYADDAIVVVDKMAGFLSVPGKGPDKQDCAESRIRQQFPHATGSITAHRLDMATSGLLVYGLNPDIQSHLSKQFQDRTVSKKYIAVIEGIPVADAGMVELQFRVDLDNRPHQILDPIYGKTGLTYWKRIAIEGTWCRLELIPHTGRTHQLRLHTAHPAGIGIPIVGDLLYGNPALSDRLLLHATELSFIHPVTEEEVTFHSPVPF